MSWIWDKVGTFDLRAPRRQPYLLDYNTEAGSLQMGSSSVKLL